MTNLLTHADAQDVCARLPAEIRFDLVYLDPPYGVGTTMAARLAPGQARGRKKVESGPDAYEDREDADALTAMLVPRLAAIRERMAEGATLYLHLDHRAVHELMAQRRATAIVTQAPAATPVPARAAFTKPQILWTPSRNFVT